MKSCALNKKIFIGRSVLLLMILCCAFIAASSSALYASELTHHALKVTLYPEDRRIAAEDTITLAGDQRDLRFVLHAGLNPTSPDPHVRIAKEGDERGLVPLESFIVTLPAGLKSFTIRYAGKINHPFESTMKEQARGFQDTPGLISKEGVYLSGSSAWYPLIETKLVTFMLDIELPAGWDAVSEGSRMAHEKKKEPAIVRWDSPEPVEEIHLIAYRFTEYAKVSGNLTAMAFLRTPDEGLANKYLDATVRYITMYDALIGPYPYKKFALVENFWETGLGMPSFTLLGPTIIRLPFIINTSYPHEILHNWWGNSVFPVYEKGNWSEGITAYLADHMMKEQQGEGAEYRLTTLQKYADYVLGGRDFPLTRFTSRHSPATEAVGYGKALMFFHMIRLDLGDKTFIHAIRDFYQKNKFRFASFLDLEKSFEAVSRKDLKAEFDQWITKTGAPKLQLSDSRTAKRGNGYTVTAHLEQVQPEDAYLLRIPVAVTMEGQERAYQTVVDMNGKKLDLSLAVPYRPLRLDIDPEFDVFRRLDREEIPPAISLALGSKKMLVLLPSSAGKEMLKAYETFAKTLAESGPDEVTVKLDSEVKELPADRTVTVLGWENRFFEKTIAAWNGYDVKFTGTRTRIGKTVIEKGNHALVLTARSPENRDTALMFIAADRRDPLPGLGRKLPHYHKYSYLAFEGDEPVNIAKGRWQVVNSPMTAFLPGTGGGVEHVEMGRLIAREPLATLPSDFSSERMMEAVRFLSSNELKGREIGTPEIDKAADYLAEKFKQAGLVPGGDHGSYYQQWHDPDGKAIMKNVIAVIPGKKPASAHESVVIGAHYDHLGFGMSIGRSEDRGAIHPGADDNASGVAVLLELARVLKESLLPDRSIVFVAFTGEEEGKLGSHHYVMHEKSFPVSKCMAMVNLDTVGRLGKKKLLVLGGGSAAEWVHIFRGAGFVTGVDIELVSEELDSSDQESFQGAGVPAVQLFSGPNLDYHRPGDTADKIDPAGLVKVASVAKEVVEYLAGREEPLSSLLKHGEAVKTAPKTERTVSLGTIPDFAYQGKGFRLSGVAPGSPAEAAGMREGDVILAINGREVEGLKGLSDILKSLSPGDRISITFLRDGTERATEAVVKGK
ncbi:MAG TPA: M20/M25/M40 family metallo-hydrolase [Nitrospirota bacterium]|nr:M20/M25/M40 family metallo-hydrolase [Nitrospirota bacterium]